jgi:hypothetical protein
LQPLNVGEKRVRYLGGDALIGYQQSQIRIFYGEHHFNFWWVRKPELKRKGERDGAAPWQKTDVNWSLLMPREVK